MTLFANTGVYACRLMYRHAHHPNAFEENINRRIIDMPEHDNELISIKSTGERVKYGLKQATKWTLTGIGCCGGLPYLNAAYEWGAQFHPLLGQAMRVGVGVSVAGYAGWGWEACSVRVFMRERIQALVPEESSQLYDRIIYPGTVLVIGLSSLIPIAYFSYTVSGGQLSMGLLTIVTDTGLRVLSLDEFFSHAQLMRKFTNTLCPPAMPVDPHLTNLFTTFVGKLEFALTHCLHYLPPETLKGLLAREMVVKEDGQLRSPQLWQEAFLRLLTESNKIQRKQNIFLMHEFFTRYGVNIFSLIPAASLIAIEAYLGYKAGEMFIADHHIDIAIAAFVVAPIGYLQYLVVSDVCRKLYATLVSRLSCVDSPSWITAKHPFLSLGRIFGSIAIGLFSWGAVAAFIDAIFSGWLHKLLFWTVIPSDFLLLTGGLLELGARAELMIIRWCTSDTDYVDVYYQLLLLIDELKSADPRVASYLMNDFSPKLRAAIEGNDSVEAQEKMALIGGTSPDYNTFSKDSLSGSAGLEQPKEKGNKPGILSRVKQIMWPVPAGSDVNERANKQWPFSCGIL